MGLTSKLFGSGMQCGSHHWSTWQDTDQYTMEQDGRQITFYQRRKKTCHHECDAEKNKLQKVVAVPADEFGELLGEMSMLKVNGGSLVKGTRFTKKVVRAVQRLDEDSIEACIERLAANGTDVSVTIDGPFDTE